MIYAGKLCEDSRTCTKFWEKRFFLLLSFLIRKRTNFCVIQIFQSWMKIFFEFRFGIKNLFWYQNFLEGNRTTIWNSNMIEKSRKYNTNSWSNILLRLMENNCLMECKYIKYLLNILTCLFHEYLRLYLHRFLTMWE